MTKLPPDVMKRSLALVSKITEQFEGQDDRVVGFTLALVNALYVARNASVHHQQEAVLELQIETMRMMMPVARNIVDWAAKDDGEEEHP